MRHHMTLAFAFLLLSSAGCSKPFDPASSLFAAPPTVTPPGPDSVPVPPSPVQGIAQLPQRTVETTMPAAPGAGGSVTPVAANEELQAVLDAAKPGDVIELARGATYTGNFVLRNKGASNAWIIIRPAPGLALPPEGTRMTPALAASLALPKIITPSGENAIRTAVGAHHYRLVGLEITLTPVVSAGSAQHYGLVGLGADAFQGQRTLADVAHDLVLDRLYVHGLPGVALRRCIALNSASSAVIDSYVSECHDAGADAQAIGGWNGPGPFLIRNNWLEGSTENVMFGGSDAGSAELSPADITIQRNYLSKPLSWKGGPWAVKTIFELKNAKRVLMEGNVLEGNWPAVWGGEAVALKSVNQDGTAPWSGTTDVTFRLNLIRNTGSGINLHSNPEPSKAAVAMARITISNNIIIGLNSPQYSGSGKGLFLGGSIADLTYEHNTTTWVGLGGRGIEFEGDPPQIHPRIRITANIFATVGGLSLTGQALGYPGPSWAAWGGPGGTLADNVFAVGECCATGQWNQWVTTFPPGNTLLQSDDTSFSAVGFVSATDLHLAPTSPVKGRASGNTDPGADVSAVMSAVRGAISGTP